MLSFLLKDCTDCDSLEDTICKIDGTLAQYGKDGWHNITYMTQKSLPWVQVKRLIYYQNILNTLKWSQGTYCPMFNFQHIVSRASAISNSITPIVRRVTAPPHTTTTTTTTSSTTSTSTTSTTTSTTTHTTTTTSTTSTTTTSTSTQALSTFSLTNNNGASGYLTVVRNTLTAVNQTTTGTGTVRVSNGDTIVVSVGDNTPGTVTLVVTDVTTSTVLSTTSQGGLSPLTSYSFTGSGHVYSFVGTTIQTTSTTTTTTTHSTTTTTTTSTTHTTSTTTTTTTT